MKSAGLVDLLKLDIRLISERPLTLLASFLFSLVAIASRRSTPKCHGFIRTVSFISAKTNILEPDRLRRTNFARRSFLRLLPLKKSGTYFMWVGTWCKTT